MRTRQIVACAIAMLIVSSCSGGGTAATTPSAPGAPSAPGIGAGTSSAIEMGGVFELSGLNAAFGRNFYEDAVMVFDDVNARGGINGRKVNVHYEDSASNAATGVAVTRKLIDRDNVKIIIGGIFTPVALAIAKIANEEQVLFYSPGSAAPGLTTPTQKYVFAVNQTQDISSKGIAQLISSMKAKKVGLIEETDAYGEAAHSTLESRLSQYGLKIDVTATIAADAIDATSQIVKLKQAGVDVIVVGTTITPATAAVKAAYQQGVGIPLVAYGGGNSPSIETLLTTSNPVTYYVITPLACPLDGNCAKGFLSAYKKAFPGGSPSVWTGLGYAATLAFAEALKSAKSYSPADVAAALETMPPYSNPIIPYPIKFSPTNHVGTPDTFLQGFKDGKLFFFGNDVTQNRL